MDTQQKKKRKTKDEADESAEDRHDKYGFKTYYDYLKSNIDRHISDWNMAKEALLSLRPQVDKLDTTANEEERSDIEYAMFEVGACVDPDEDAVRRREQFSPKEVQGTHAYELIKFGLKDALDAVDMRMEEARQNVRPKRERELSAEEESKPRGMRR